MIQPKGPGAPYQLLFSAEQGQPPSLPEAFRQIYPGDWPLPVIAGRPYVYTNFATSRDGRISYNVKGQEAAAFVTKADPHDRWLMGLLRMRADAVLIGDGTIRMEPDYNPTAEFIYPPEAEAFKAQRLADGLDAVPLVVVLSFNGALPAHAHCLHNPDQRLIMATTAKGAINARSIQCVGHMDILDLGEDSADLHKLMRILHDDYGIHNLLCEGGAHVFAGLLDAGLVDEEFVTWCPVFVGRDAANFRPSYAEGVAWLPDAAPYSEPISLHKAGDYLYLRTRCRYQKTEDGGRQTADLVE
ncbi:MAG: dihydrofolate reductase family protein [Caldilineaceae bacterium]|nr:dihydrofolate reductase family protein [Caldilineaceae bacterium]